MNDMFKAADGILGDWLLSPLSDVVQSEEFSGLQLSAADAILMLADRIERDGIAPGDEKALADLIRYLVQLPLQRPV